ncbi:hypothetical protein PINS_up013507 [Pythium insidiosum]|nr:hypothetical protein PINS_up013507 [Pythium insidiosum]
MVDDQPETQPDAAQRMDVVDAATLSYEAFCERYMAANRPVRIRNVVDAWFPRTREWTTADGAGIAFDHLIRSFGHLHAPVVDGTSGEYGAQTRTTMSVGEYMELLKTGAADKLYLKDWHLVRAAAFDPPLYETPPYFADDWLNWWWDRKAEPSEDGDYRFVYIGPAGSWTPLHHDVFGSYSWSVNITGQKQWIFFPPEDEPKLKDRFGRTVLPDWTSTDYDRSLYPLAHTATPLYVTQDAGEAIFVPSRWYHQVKNVVPTISINHNWFNGFNVCAIWSFLSLEWHAVQRELEHLQALGLVGDEFRAQCLVVMRANTGMDLVEFQALLTEKANDLQTIVDSSDAWQQQTARDHLATVEAILTELQDALQVESGKLEER